MSLHRKIGDGWLDRAKWAEEPVATTLRTCAKELVEAFMDPPVPDEGTRVRVAGYYGVVVSAEDAMRADVHVVTEWGLVAVLMDGGTKPVPVPVDRVEVL